MQPLPSGGRLAHAAILGHDGGVWAQDPGFPEVTDAEVAALLRGMDDPAPLAQSGIRLAGEKYMMVAGEPGEVLRGKKGPGGVTVKKTVGALVVGIYGEGVGHGECNIVSAVGCRDERGHGVGAAAALLAACVWGAALRVGGVLGRSGGVERRGVGRRAMTDERRAVRCRRWRRWATTSRSRASEPRQRPVCPSSARITWYLVFFPCRPTPALV
jgi:profilin